VDTVGSLFLEDVEMDFTEIGYTHGRLSQQYQPTPFPLPTPCKDCSDTELLAFWTGFDKGWMDSEERQELCNASAINF
jgi:hypothetical protein